MPQPFIFILIQKRQAFLKNLCSVTWVPAVKSLCGGPGGPRISAEKNPLDALASLDNIPAVH
jgi:hypothetical protein